MTNVHNGTVSSGSNAFDAMRVLERVKQDPAVVGFQREIDRLQSQRDQVDVALSMDRTGRFACFPEAAARHLQAAAATSMHREARMTCVEGFAGLCATMTCLAFGCLDAAVYLGIGTCAAAVYLMPKLNAYTERRFVLPAMTDKGLKTELTEAQSALGSRLEEVRACKTRLEGFVMQSLLKEIDAQQAANAAKGAASVERREQTIKIGNLELPVRTPASGAPTAG